MPKYLTALLAVLGALPPPSGGALPRARPTFLRIRVVLATESLAADLTLDTGTIVNASVLSDARGVRVRAERNRLSFKRESDGPAEAHVRLLVSGIRTDARVRWHLTLSPSAAPTEVEVYNENEPGHARLVDRFSAEAEESTFESPVDRLLAGGPIGIPGRQRPLVLAFFYPWYLHQDWSNDRLLDRPLYLYSTEFPGEIAQSLGDARDAGLDGVIVSWRGDTDWNERRLRFVLDEAQKLGLKVSILIETQWATEGPEGTKKPLVADKMRRWLEKAFDAHTLHPAFLRTHGRPVIFVYVADSFSRDDWRAMVQSLERGGRHIFLMADSLDPAFLESFSGAFTYSTASISQSDLERFYSDQALRTESYDLLFGGERRIDAATVIPGYDDSRLDRETTMVVDRANATLYEAQWQAAVAAQPDWILVTSWNEFWENTHIEPSVRYGHRYQRRTRTWSELFRRQGRDPGRSPVSAEAR